MKFNPKEESSITIPPFWSLQISAIFFRFDFDKRLTYTVELLEASRKHCQTTEETPAPTYPKHNRIGPHNKKLE